MNTRKSLTRTYLLLSFAFLILGVGLLTSGSSNLTGAAIGAGSRYNPALGIIFAAVSLLMFALVHHKNEQHNQDLNSFRRWLEKKQHIKLNYDYAKERFEEVEDRYYDAVGRGIVKRDYAQPLRFIEDYLLSEEGTKEGIPYSPKEGLSKLEKEKLSEVDEYLAKGVVIRDYDSLRSLAIRMGYVVKHVKEGYGVYKIGENEKLVRVTEIPTHSRELGTGLAKKIMKDLSAGYRHKARESSRP